MNQPITVGDLLMCGVLCAVVWVVGYLVRRPPPGGP